MEYVIIVEDDNSLYGSRKCRIMHREKLFNKLYFLVPQYYNGYDMSQCTVTMRYLRPISKEFETETLVLSEEKYKDYLRYSLPIDTNLSKEFGDLELNLTFTMLDVDDNGNVVQRVRKTESHILKITPLPNWDNVVPDSALSALDQRIIKLDAIQKSIQEQNQVISTTKADNIKYIEETNEIQLLSGEKEIGNKVRLKSYDVDLEDGIPVVDFGSDSSSDEDDSPEDTNDSNVVDF